MDSFLTQYYEHRRSGIPKQIVLELALPKSGDL